MADNQQNERGQWEAADDLGGGLKVGRFKMQFGADGVAQDVSVSAPLPSMAPGSAFVDVSIASLSAGQVAGTASIIGANPARKSLMINPPADCVLTLSSGAVRGLPLFGGVANSITGQECPTNALYVSGLSTGAALTIWEG